MNNTQCVAEMRISAADSVLAQAEQVALMAEALNDQYRQKLGRICREPAPTRELEQAEGRREYPAYFSELSEKLGMIRCNLAGMEDIISRCEV